MEKITIFTIDHLKLRPRLYVSRKIIRYNEYYIYRKEAKNKNRFSFVIVALFLNK
ncbi:MAG TPA: hypothetical protein PLT36_03145 [Erysipelotrichaceae bacterium]|nr:hypothetical protein [Erysipelotrichaceae bacterium]HQA85176.1 hypothetical protein [Erysipelotrichaceae bacterium]